MKIRSIFLVLMLAGTMGVNQSCSTEKSTTGTVDNAPGNIPRLAHDDPRRRVSQEKFIEANKMDMLGDHQQALNLYKECVKIDPSNDAAYYSIAKILYSSKQYMEAAQYAQQAVKLDPENTWYLDFYGTLLGGLGNFKEAQKYMSKWRSRIPKTRMPGSTGHSLQSRINSMMRP